MSRESLEQKKSSLVARLLALQARSETLKSELMALKKELEVYHIEELAERMRTDDTGGAV